MFENSFTEVKESKKLIEKIKKVCSAMAKFNLNSPCLLQFVRINGEIEVVLTYDPHNGDNFDFYKIFNVVTYDNFEIKDEDLKYFDNSDDRVSIPVIISTFPIAECTDKTKINPIPYYAGKNYCYSLDSYYVFPKFVYEAIKCGAIKGFETLERSFDGNIHMMNVNINIIDDERYRHVLFIHNEEKLERIFKLSIFPLHKASGLNELFLKMFLDSANSKVILNPELWKTNYEKYKDYNAYKLFGFNQHPFLIYHNDFFPSKITYGFAAKYYENSETSNIASLYFDIELSGKIHEYFKYKYYDI